MVKGVRKLPNFKSIPIVVITEVYSLSGTMVMDALERGKVLQNIYTLKERYSIVNGNKYIDEGVPKTHDNTVKYFEYFVEAITQHDIAIYGNVYTADVERDKEIGKLVNMMRNLKWLKQTNKLTGKESYYLTAKSTNESDDSLIALMMTFYWRKVFVNSGRYQNIIETINMSTETPDLKF